MLLWFMLDKKSPLKEISERRPVYSVLIYFVLGSLFAYFLLN